MQFVYFLMLSQLLLAFTQIEPTNSLTLDISMVMADVNPQLLLERAATDNVTMVSCAHESDFDDKSPEKLKRCVAVSQIWTPAKVTSKCVENMIVQSGDLTQTQDVIMLSDVLKLPGFHLCFSFVRA